MKDLSGLELFLAILLVIGFLFGIACIEVGIATWLWGIIAVEIFGLPALTFWEMFALRFLIWLIFPTSTASTIAKIIKE